MVAVSADVLIDAATLIGGFAEREHQAEARGYKAGYAEGYDAGIAALASVRHAMVCSVQDERAMWGGRRQDFGRPRPGDFPGRGGDAA